MVRDVCENVPKHKLGDLNEDCNLQLLQYLHLTSNVRPHLTSLAKPQDIHLTDIKLINAADAR